MKRQELSIQLINLISERGFVFRKWNCQYKKPGQFKINGSFSVTEGRENPNLWSYIVEF